MHTNDCVLLLTCRPCEAGCVRLLGSTCMPGTNVAAYMVKRILWRGSASLTVNEEEARAEGGHDGVVCFNFA